MPKNKRNKHKKTRQWRAIDTSDIEQVRFQKTEDTLRGGDISSKKDDELFFVDVSFATNAQVPAEERKKQAREKMLYVDQILQPNPYTKAEKTAPPPRKKQIRKRKRAEMTETPKDPNANSKDSTEEYYDIWDEPPATDSVTEEPLGFDPEFYKPAVKRVKTRKPKKPTNHKAVEVAHPGASYNPTYEDHQELLAKAVAFHLRERDKEKKLARFSRMEKGPKGVQESLDVMWGMEQVYTSIGGTESEEQDETEIKVEIKSEEVSAEMELNPSIEEQAVNPSNEEVDTKNEDEEALPSNENEDGEVDINEEETVLTEVKEEPDDDNYDSVIAEGSMESEVDKQAEEEFAVGESVNIRLKKKKKRGPKAKRIAKNKLIPEEPEYLRTDQLPSSLRTLPSRFSLLRDRYSSLQKRNLVEYRLPTRKKQRSYGRKIVEKHSAQDW